MNPKLMFETEQVRGGAVRRMDEPIAVVTDAPAGAPVAFTWRGRAYVVREVLDHWRERRAWWRVALESGARSPTDESDAWRIDDLEEGVWRVAASPGRALTTGVYDVGHSGSWRLIRIVD